MRTIIELTAQQGGANAPSMQSILSMPSIPTAEPDPAPPMIPMIPTSTRPTNPTSHPTNPTNPTSQTIAIPEIPQKNFHRNSFASKLSPEQIAKLDHWFLIDELTLDEVTARVPLPEPTGLGLRITRSALGRYSENLHLQERLSLHLELAQTTNGQTTFPQTLQEFADYALFNRSFDPRIFNSLIRFHRTQLDTQHRHKTETQRDQELQLLATRLRLETLKVQINIARKALEHAARLQSILANNQTDDEDKIHETRGLLFEGDFIPTPE